MNPLAACVARALRMRAGMKTILFGLPLALAFTPACGGSSQPANDESSQKAEDNAQRAEDKADEAKDKAEGAAEKAEDKAGEAKDKAEETP